MDFLAAYGSGGANAPLGFEKQGRIGYVIVTLDGKVNDWLSYKIAVNPVDESAPLPGCGESGFFYPNNPIFLWGPGTTVPCQATNGNRRVDAYRGIALDPVPQQGPIREAFADMRLGKGTALRFGRMLLPIGFGWQELGAMTSKDAPRIQRIDPQADFGAMLTDATPAADGKKPLLSTSVAGVLGAGNRWFDYDCYCFEDGSLDANSAPAFLWSATVTPIDAVDVRSRTYRRRP